MSELLPAIHDEIERLCKDGNALMDQDEYAEALAVFNRAYKLVPLPKDEWKETTWLMAAIGEGCFFRGDYEEGRKALSYGMKCPGGFGNPFMHLRLGQCEYELGNLQRAGDELARAYLQEGTKLFACDDPKYLAFIKGLLKEPIDGWQEGW